MRLRRRRRSDAKRDPRDAALHRPLLPLLLTDADEDEGTEEDNDEPAGLGATLAVLAALALLAS